MPRTIPYRAAFRRFSALTLLACLVVSSGPIRMVRGAEFAIDTPALRFTVQDENGAWQLMDKQSGATWKSNATSPRFGVATLTAGNKPVDLAACAVERKANALVATFKPLADMPDAQLKVTISPDADGRTLHFSCEVQGELHVSAVDLIDRALAISATEGGYAVVPVREGMIVPADTGLAFTHRFDTYAYEGCHMAMLGMVKAGSALLLTWENPYIAADLQSVVENGDARSQVLTASLSLRQPAHAFKLQVLGKGDHVAIAHAYQAIARQRGWLVPWSQKIAENPARGRLIGTINFKLWSTLSRRMNAESTKEESSRINWTFDEVGAIAEHLKNDLKLEKVFFMIGGWIRRGYDNQHPDILPAAIECGGDEGLDEAARRVMAQGYLFCLHDNYQDMYKDSPSWDERYLQKQPDGKPTVGGHWDGGRAYITCSKMAVELARRPQNLPAVKKLTNADAYFIDTTYAAGLQECFDPQHRLTRADDMKWKQVISDEARAIFGIFGSECGREWALPHCDFFEGLTGVSGTYYHDKNLTKKLGASVVPLFEAVYRDGIAMWGKYGYDINQSAEYVLHHIAIGRPLHYHSIPSHLYWKQAFKEPPSPPADGAPDAALYVRSAGGWAEGMHPMDRFIKNTYEILSPLYELTARSQVSAHAFLTPDRKVQRTVFGQGDQAMVVVVNAGSSPWQHKLPGLGEVVLPPNGFIVESPSFAAFCIMSLGGRTYDQPALFTLRSLDGKPLKDSGQLRIYHGFGDGRLRLWGRDLNVAREAVVGGN